MALQCAREIQKEFLNRQNISGPEMLEIMFTMGISVGQPLTETEGFFVEAIRTSQRLCFIAGENELKLQINQIDTTEKTKPPLRWL
jgi:hypothetical protein